MFSADIERAIGACITAHDGQWRRGGEGVPYSVHPLHMALMLARWNFDEVSIQAALLHDIVEDCEEWTLEGLRKDFGPRVASIVAELTEDKSLSWAERKEAGIASVPGLSSEAASVKAVDKLHNLQSLRASLECADDHSEIWGQFRGGREGTLAVAKRLVNALVARVDPKLGRALKAAHEAVLRLDQAQTKV